MYLPVVLKGVERTKRPAADQKGANEESTPIAEQPIGPTYQEGETYQKGSDRDDELGQGLMS